MVFATGCNKEKVESSTENYTEFFTSIASEDTTITASETPENTALYSYGVFLSVENDLDKLSDYYTVVIDAQNFSKGEIESFKNKGHKVYSYINIGSLENFRNYYNDYKALKLGDYEHWEEEIWIDVSSQKWQESINVSNTA